VTVTPLRLSRFSQVSGILKDLVAYFNSTWTVLGEDQIDLPPHSCGVTNWRRSFLKNASLGLLVITHGVNDIHGERPAWETFSHC
jgi:hypothetical protein